MRRNLVIGLFAYTSKFGIVGSKPQLPEREVYHDTGQKRA